MTRKLTLLAVILFALSGCALPTLYQPAGTNDGYGYSQEQLETNRFRVTFTGNDLTARQTVENYLLYRAAEITLAHGKDYFVVTNRDTEARTRYYNSGFGGGYYGDDWGPWGPWHHHPPFWGSGSGTPITQYRASAEIVIYAGRKPADNPNAYDAHNVMSHIAPSIVRPAPPKAG